MVYIARLVCMFHHFIKKTTGDKWRTYPVRMLLNAYQRSCWSRMSQLDCSVSFRVPCRVQLICTTMAKLSSEKMLEASVSLPTSLWSWLERFGSAPQQTHKASLVRASGWYRWLDLFLVENSQGMSWCNYLSISRANEHNIYKWLRHSMLG